MTKEECEKEEAENRIKRKRNKGRNTTARITKRTNEGELEGKVI